ncbi:drug/metabolite exporter YedA [soil metagenome]
MQTGNKNKAYLALTATSIIWGTTWVASRIGVEDVPGLQVSYLRQFIAGCLLLSFYFIRGEKLPTWQQFRWLFILSIFTFVLANGFSTWSVKYIPGGLASLISALAPICVVLIDLAFFRQHKNTPLTFIGLLIGFAGVAIVFYENAFHKQPEGYILGIIYGVIAMLGWSIGTVFISRNKYNINPYYAMGWQMFLSSFMIFGLAKVTNNNIPISDVTLKTWGAIAYLIIMGSVFAFAAFIYSIKHLPTAIASLYAYINPIVAMLLGTLILDEPLTLSLLFGAIVTLVGVYIVNYSIKKT